MRILHLDAGKEMRGGQWQVLRLIEGLAVAGVESTLLAREDAPLYTEARKRLWRVLPLGITRVLGSLRTHDVIHAHDARSHTLGAFVRGLPLVVSRRVSFPVGSRWKYGRARRYLAVSEFVKGVLLEGGVPEEKISVVYDGVPILPVARGRQVLGLEKDSALLAHMGLKIVSDLEKDLADAAIMVYVTNSEGLGSGALLAMSAGVPVIASNVGGLPEVIRHGENGLLVENNAETIQHAILELQRDPEQARRIGDAARHTIMERFTVEQMVHRTLEVYPPGDAVIEAGIAFVFGLLIGSFLNVCIHRWPRNRSVVKPRSHCVRCRKTIAWYDNIPLVSYAILGGKCRHCRAKISWRYPLVELLTALLFFHFVSTLGLTLAALKMCVFSAILIALIFSDMEKRILPDEFTKGGIVLGLIFAFFVPVPDITAQALFWMAGAELSGWMQSLAESAAGAFLPAFFLWGGGWLYYKVRHREGLGFGDVKLIAMVGSFMGLRGALLTLILGSVAGSVIGFSYIKLTGKDPATYELPFGTFLGFAALAAAIAEKQLLAM